MRGILLRRQAGRCWWCGRGLVDVPAGYDGPRRPDHATVDHVVPVGAGGRLGIANAVAACHGCNEARVRIHAPQLGLPGPNGAAP